MKISEVIRELESYRETYGDLPVKVRDAGGMLRPAQEVLSWKPPVPESKLCVCIETHTRLYMQDIATEALKR